MSCLHNLDTVLMATNSGHIYMNYGWNITKKLKSEPGSCSAEKASRLLLTECVTRCVLKQVDGCCVDCALGVCRVQRTALPVRSGRQWRRVTPPEIN